MQLHMIVMAAIFGILTTYDRWWLFLFLLLFLVIRKHAFLTLSSIPILLIFIVFSFYTTWYEDLHATRLNSEWTDFTGLISSNPLIDGNKLSFRYTLPHNEQILVQYTIPSIEEQKKVKMLAYGDRCSLSGRLQKPSVNRNPYAFNYRSYLKRTFNIHWLLKLDHIDMRDCHTTDGPIIRLHEYRKERIESIQRDYPETLSGLMNTLVFGERSGLSESLLEQYQKLGLIHLLAVSGLHVGTMLGLMYVVFIRCGVIKEAAIISILCTIPLLILLTGGAPSVIRAGLMAGTACVGLLLRLKMRMIDQMSLVALVMLLIKPTYIFHIGFQLSFLITASLLLSNTYILKRLSPFKQLLSSSFIATLVSLPIVLWHFFEVSIWTLPLNIIYIPIMTLILLPAVFLTYLLYTFFPFPVWRISSYVVEKIFGVIHSLMDWFEALPLGTVTTGKLPSIVAILLTLSILVWLFIWENRRTAKSFIQGSFICFLTFVIIFTLPKLDRNAYVTVLDVGQGDAIVLEAPFRQAVYVIDTGGRLQFQQEDWMERSSTFDTGKDIVATYLKARGIRKIDALILTHPDYDHIGGTAGLIENVEVLRIITGVWDETSSMRKLKHHQVPLLAIKEDLEWPVNGGHIRLLGKDQEYPDRNNRSLIIHANFYGQRFLFTGDIESEREINLIEQYPFLKAEFLKVAHHGSQTSTTEEFLDYVDPKVAIISAGEKNRYGHPDADVLSRLAEKGVKVLQTGKSGGIKITIHPEKVHVEKTMQSE
ncbi:DNA internalization-related competence protein ComEC/Rec2 [Pseudalkalibacillus sp. SCS-8]|uniref:DNA internalization-related competence protein ComEC/Rec2 n=1 Tax=Pseudalkalibacillus nanhaiensis TaxID=3115291 RepID=UPI0032DB9290